MVNTQVNVVMPRIELSESPREFYSSGRKYRVLWLLHGSCGDHTDWIRNTNIARYAEERDFIAGLSMGGNGALMMGLGHPELFQGVAVLSSTAREIEYLRPFSKMTSAEFRMAAKDPVKFPGPNGTGMRLKEINQVAKYDTVQAFLNSCENTWNRLPEVVREGKLPKTYVSCGTKDKNLYPRFLRFKKYAGEIGADIFFEEEEGFDHEFALWDISIRKAMDYFGIDKKSII